MKLLQYFKVIMTCIPSILCGIILVIAHNQHEFIKEQKNELIVLQEKIEENKYTSSAAFNVANVARAEIRDLQFICKDLAAGETVEIRVIRNGD